MLFLSFPTYVKLVCGICADDSAADMMMLLCQLYNNKNKLFVSITTCKRDVHEFIANSTASFVTEGINLLLVGFHSD